MQFTKLKVSGLAPVEFPIVGALPSDPYILKSVDGLGPPEVDVFISGRVYQNRRPQNREIVMLVGLNPDFSVGQTAEELRTTLYELMNPGYQEFVAVYVMDGSTHLAMATGYLKKIEVALFSKDPAVQITIACESPHLENYLTIHPDTASLSKSNPQIVNAGDAPTGFYMEVIFTGSHSSWTLNSSYAFKKMQFTHNFASGDKLIINTREGERAIQLDPAGAGGVENLIASLSSDSTWLSLFKGTNSFSTSSTGFNWGDVYFTPLYWGV